jgi:hypothetical protein
MHYRRRLLAMAGRTKAQPRDQHCFGITKACQHRGQRGAVTGVDEFVQIEYAQPVHAGANVRQQFAIRADLIAIARAIEQLHRSGLEVGR